MDPENISQILNELNQTQHYACDNLAQLSGGTANFVFRGALQTPLNDGSKSIIIKHTKEYSASNKNFQLPAERCLIEEAILKALNGFPAATIPTDTGRGEITVKTPRLFSFNPASFTQIAEDLPDSVDLKTFFTTPGISARVQRDWALSIGRAMGTWLHSFHSWASEEAQSDLVGEMQKNPLRDLKFSINYDNMVSLVDTYPDLLAESREVFQQVRDMAAGQKDSRDGEGCGLIHGDFWSGNVLIPKNALDNQSSNTRLFVIDWELAHCGTRGLDLGQMMAELYMLKHFKDIDAGPWVIEGFVKGYYNLTEDMAYRALIQVGVHFICWGTMVKGWGTDEQVREVVRAGRDLIVKAWLRERSWFEGGFWKCLFTRD